MRACEVSVDIVVKMRLNSSPPLERSNSHHIPTANAPMVIINSTNDENSIFWKYTSLRKSFGMITHTHTHSLGYCNCSVDSYKDGYTSHYFGNVRDILRAYFTNIGVD